MYVCMLFICMCKIKHVDSFGLMVKIIIIYVIKRDEFEFQITHVFLFKQYV